VNNNRKGLTAIAAGIAALAFAAGASAQDNESGFSQKFRDTFQWKLDHVQSLYQ
jgi:hypothetical protein